METEGLKAALEAILFVSGDPLPLKRIQEALEGEEKPVVLEAMEALSESYREEGRGIQIVEIAGGYQIVTKPAYTPFIKRLEKIKAPTKLSKSALEALAVIAYKQPVTRGEVEAIRGVDSSNVVRTLLEKRIIRIVGRKEGLGRPMLYGTTLDFLQFFGMRDLSQLPALKDFKELAGPQQEFEAVSEPVGELSN
jgi:segregation and condensation protein B